MRLPVKLTGGGRYDGDEEVIDVDKIPEQIWAYNCGAGPLCQVAGGIHWSTTNVDDIHVEFPELYVHTGFGGEVDEMPVAIYVLASVFAYDEAKDA